MYITSINSKLRAYDPILLILVAIVAIKQFNINLINHVFFYLANSRFHKNTLNYSNKLISNATSLAVDYHLSQWRGKDPPLKFGIDIL